MTKQAQIENIPRTQAEILQLGKEVISYLQHLCEDYDMGNTFAIVLVAVLLRTLLKTKGSTESVLKQLGKDTIDFVDTRAPIGSFSYWTFGDNICNHTFITQNVYGGLLSKIVTNGEHGLNLDYQPLLNKNRNADKQSFDDWYTAIVFKDSTFQLSREDCINIVADKDGGAHLDKRIPPKYSCFREPTALQFIIDGQIAVFNQNPVYVSIRQIAWEVLESLKRAKVI